MILIPAIGSLVLIEWETKDQDDVTCSLQSVGWVHEANENEVLLSGNTNLIDGGDYILDTKSIKAIYAFRPEDVK